MLSPIGILASSTIHTRKQKTSNHTEYDLKMTSNDINMTSSEPNKSMENKLKGGMADDNSSNGIDLMEQTFSSR